MNLAAPATLAAFGSIFLFWAPRISSYANPIFWYWVAYLGSSLIALCLSPDVIIDTGIYISMLACFMVFCEFSPPLNIFFRHGANRVSNNNIVSISLLILIFVFPLVTDALNHSSVAISTFGERNSTIESMPLAVISRAASGFLLPYLFLASGRARKTALLLLATSLLYSIVTFSFSSSKSIFLGIPFAILTISFSDNSFAHAKLIRLTPFMVSLNTRIKPIAIKLQSAIINQAVSTLLLVEVLGLSTVAVATIILLSQFNFAIDAIIYRICYNFDTLIYLTQVLDHSQGIDYTSSGFYSIISVYIKPYLGLLGKSQLYEYRSIPQYVMSIRQGSYYLYTSLGNSNLIAECIVSSNYIIGLVSAPLVYFIYLQAVRLSFKIARGDYILNIIALFAYFQCYNFFASGQEVIMSLTIPATLFGLRLLILKTKINNRATLSPDNPRVE